MSKDVQEFRVLLPPIWMFPVKNVTISLLFFGFPIDEVVIESVEYVPWEVEDCDSHVEPLRPAKKSDEMKGLGRNHCIVYRWPILLSLCGVQESVPPILEW